MENYSEVGFINMYKGEYANDYTTRLKYVEMGAFERDYFADWLESETNSSCYPSLDEIADFCNKVQKAIDKWFEGVYEGVIDSEAGWKDTSI